MGDFASPNTDLISQERLQRRLDGYRKHHSDNKIHYDNYANAEYEKVNEDTKVLYQKWLEGKNKKTKNKSNKSDVNKDVNQMKPKPKVNAVKPMVINPIVAERGVEPSCPSYGSKPNVNPCNESQKQTPPFQNASNAGSVHVNINLDANLAQAQNGITLRFSSRITGNNVTSSSENNPMTNASSDCGNTQQLCKAEMNDLSLCEGDNSELDNFLNSGPVDDDLGIDFEFLNGLDDSCEFFSDANNPLPPPNDVPLSPKGNLVNQSIAPLPNQSIISQQKQNFQNQPTNMQLPSNFSRIELNISSDMSKFSSILGETPGPAAETLKHLAAKHINQEKVQQKMIHSSDMYPMKQCYTMPHMPGNGAFVNDSNAMMGVNNFRLPYSQCQSMGLDGQSNIMVEGMKGKTPPCYQDTKAMYPHQMQVQQQNMQFTEQKLNVAGTMKEGDMKLEMKYDFEQCRLTQESQMLPQGGMNKMYQNCVVSQTNSIQADCFRMQKQKSVVPGYQRFLPYPSQGRPRFVTMGNNNNNSSVPSNFNQNQIESAGLYDSESYGLMMNSRQQVCMQSQQACGPQRHGGSMALVNPVQTRQNGVKEGMMMEEFKSGSADMMCYPNVNMQMPNGAACHSQMNPGLFYGDGQPPPSYHNISSMMMAGPQMRSKWNSVPQGHPMTNKAMATSHMPINYQDVNQQQNYFPESRSYLMNGTQSYQTFHCSNPQQGVQYYTQGQEGMRMMYNAPSQGMVGQSGMNMGYNSNPKRSAPSVSYQGMRMENYNFGY